MAESLYKIPKLKGSSNYDIWNLRLTSILVKEGCQEIITIDPTKLTSSNYEGIELLRLKELESKALAIIRLSLEDGPLLSTKEITSPYILWNKLKDLYSTKGFSSEFLLSKELINTTLNSCKGNIELYLQTVSRLVTSLEARKLKLPNKFVAALVLNNLTKEYSYLVAILTQDLRMNYSNREIDLDYLFSQIIDESRRLKSIKSPNTTIYSGEIENSSKDVEMSLNSTNKSTKRTISSCNYCKKKGHIEANCFIKNPSLKNKKNINKANITREEEAFNSSIII
jgi:hypothetical protein